MVDEKSDEPLDPNEPSKKPDGHDDERNGREGGTPESSSENDPHLPKAMNGEGCLGSPDESWRAEGRLPPSSDRIAIEAARLQLDRAMAESPFVSHVFAALAVLPLEHYESLLAAIGVTADVHARLQKIGRGTLAGDFIRWCRGKHPGIFAEALAAVLATSGHRLAAQYRADLEAVGGRSGGG